MGLSQNKLAVNIGVPPRRINEIVLEKRKITAEELGDRLIKEVNKYSNVP
jgi:plasmid maintenance system antidote protein VapI